MNFFKFIGRTAASIVPKSIRPTFSDLNAMEKQRAFVRCVEGEENMTISFSYRDKNSRLLRPQSEPVEKSLARIQCTLKKHFEKESKKRKKMKLESSVPEQSELNVSLCMKGNCVDSNLSNELAWKEDARLQIGQSCFDVCRNFPTILTLTLPRFIVTGCPVFPRISSEFANTEQFVYKWFKLEVQPVISDQSKDEQSRTTKADAAAKQSREDWVEIGRKKTYTPTTADVGCKLKLMCTPRNGVREGTAREEIALRAVKNGPEMYPFEKRHTFTKEKTTKECIRIFSYNILADLYADSDYSRDFLYPYCPTVALEIDYREQLLLKEISGYNADILCLQECGKKLFEYCLQPALLDQGMNSLLFCKTGQTPEGEALFYRADRFRLLEQYDISLAEAFEKHPHNADILENVSKSEAMLNQVITRTSVVQVAVLEDLHDPGQRLCVANTHLYFHPRAGHIRLIQTVVILRHLENIKKQYAEKYPDSKLAIIFCGDLNSSPSFPGVYDLLSRKHIQENHVQWYAGGKSEFCGGMTLSHDLDFTNACASQAYTNFVAGFMASLDYVLVDGNHLEVVREIPMPSHDDVIRHVALPNEVFPSDHLAIGCEVKWSLS